MTLPRVEQQLRQVRRRDAAHLAGWSPAPPAGAAPSSAPKPPRMTFKNERFIAAHMM